MHILVFDKYTRSDILVSFFEKIGYTIKETDDYNDETIFEDKSKMSNWIIIDDKEKVENDGFYYETMIKFVKLGYSKNYANKWKFIEYNTILYVPDEYNSKILVVPYSDKVIERLKKEIVV